MYQKAVIFSFPPNILEVHFVMNLAPLCCVRWQHEHIAHEHESFLDGLSHVNALMNEITVVVIGDNDSTIHCSILNDISVIIASAWSKYQMATLFKLTKDFLVITFSLLKILDYKNCD